MGKKTEPIEIDGIRFHKKADLESTLARGDKPDEVFDAAMRLPAKIRITTMLDEDIYQELKRLAKKAGHGKYQTFLNDFLRQYLLPSENNRLLLESLVKELAAKMEKMTKTQKALEKKVDTVVASQGVSRKKAL